MSDVMTLQVRPLELVPEHGTGGPLVPLADADAKGLATKVLEEAAEAYAAWQVFEDTSEGGNAVMDRWLLSDLADELADCVTACIDLAAHYDLDMGAAMQRCEERNRERGRYGDGR